MISEILLFLFGMTAKEGLGGIVTNLLSDVLSVRISDKKLRHTVRKFKKELYIWAEQFQKKNDGTIMTSGVYLGYLENYRIIEKLYEYAFSEEEEQMAEDGFLKDLTARSAAYVQDQNGVVNDTDECVLREFYEKLLEKIKKFVRSTKGFEQQSLLYAINQVRLGNRAIYKELLLNSTLTAKSLEKIERMYLATMELLKKNGPDLDEEWFAKQNAETITNMGDRYMPELNVDLPIREEIEVMAADKDFFEQLLEKCNDLLISMNKAGGHNVAMQRLADQFVEILPKLRTFEQFNENKKSLEMLLQGVDSCAQEQIPKIIKLQHITKLQQTIESDRATVDNGYDLQLALRQCQQIRQSADELKKYLGKNTIQLLQYPFLMIHGKGGVGKSHLLAATVEDRRKNGKPSILLLGQDFSEGCIIWQRVRELLKTEPDEEHFLQRLNELAREKNSRILLVLDAINEGGGRTLWKDRLAGFVGKIAKYSYLGFVFSIRDEFMEEMTPQDLLDQCHITSLEHAGFGVDTMLVVEVYFAHYDIDMSALPYLPREFSNGLFLRLFCEGHQGKNKEDIKINTGEIYRNYLQSLNQKLADRYRYSKEIDFVYYVLRKFVEKSYGKNMRNRMDRHQATKLVFSLAATYQIPTKIYDDLLAEGVLAQSVEENEEYVYITYERLADYLFVQSRIDDVIKKRRSDEELLEELNQPGILEELTSLLPEYGMEIFERFPQLAGEPQAARAELESISWRTEEELDVDKVIDYVNEYIMPERTLQEKFFESLIWISTNENHAFNAEFFHENMIRVQMADRDAFYMPLFLSWRAEQSPISHLLNWIDQVDNGQTSAAEEHIYLCAIVLSWMLIVTDIRYRDRISAALCQLLRGHISVMKEILEQFEQVDDMYILERLYAVALGVVTYEKNEKAVNDLANYVYETIFNQEDVVADILIRDSAKEIILYANSLCPNNAIDLRKVVGPYHSRFPEIPGREEIESYRADTNKNESSEATWAENKIFSSMQIVGRDHFYGDFGRYTFQSYFQDWKDLRADDLMRIAIKDIFQRGYDGQKHGQFDYHTDDYARIQTYKVERIGKKYQWQALYKLAAQVSDQFQRENEATGELEYNTGAYEPRLRDFDPTVNDKSFVGRYGEIKPIIPENYEMDHQSWLQMTDDQPSFEKLMTISVAKEMYIGLSGFWDWDEPTPLGFEKYDCAMKNMWFMTQAYIVREADFELCKRQLESANFWGRWMPEATDNYTVYNREYYWSSVQKYFENEYYGGKEWQQIWQADRPKLADVSFLVPVYSYVATGEKGFQNISHNRWKKPCKTLYQACNLTYGLENTVMYDQSGEMICFDTVEIFGEERGFFFHKATLEKFLSENHCRIFWQLLGEKRTIGGSYRDEADAGSLEYTGFYYLEGGKLCGSTRVVDEEEF